MNKTKKIKGRLAFKSISSVVLLLVVFTLAVSFLGFRSFTDALLKQYADGAFKVAHSAANILNADKMPQYLASQGETEEYQNAFNQLDSLCNASGATFIYVIKPDLSDYGHITFIFSTVNHESEYSPYPVGYTIETTNYDYKAKYRGLYTRQLTETMLVLDSRRFNTTRHHITAMIPLVGSDHRTKAILCVERPMNELVELRKTYILGILLVLLVLGLAAILMQSTYMNRMLIQPIKKITEEASRFANENTKPKSKLTDSIRTHDEIELLAESVDTMEERIDNYIKDIVTITAEKERIGTELDMAHRIQSSMMPDTFLAFPDRSEFDIYAIMDPAKEVGGDFYDFFLIDDDHLCMVIADVSGKGVPAALFMMASKIILKSSAMDGKSAADILTQTNAVICSNNKLEMFVTIWLGILEISTGKLTAANAGHEYPTIMRPDGKFELLKDKHGLVIGAIDPITYKEYELMLEPGSKLFIYTDGVPEATDTENKMFGLDRMLEALNSDTSANPEQILSNVGTAVSEFAGGAEQFDDLTMLCMEYKGN